MAFLGKRRRATKESIPSSPICHRQSRSPSKQREEGRLNAGEIQQWQGFCEIESDPAFFNVMLHEFGVEGVKVQEVFGLDEELLAMLPKPVYGLIFLFRYRDIEEERQEAACPEQIWFANQISNNSCATVALLNIINNIPDISLGEHLQSFKDFTQSFTPALRGIEIANFEFVKGIHNSFARNMDMLISDFAMESCFNSRRAKSAKSKASLEDDTSALHFTAFVPISGEVWKLDGLDRQPENLGTVTNDEWLKLAIPILSAKMAAYEEDQTEFALLSLVKDSLPEHRSELAKSVKCMNLIDERLDKLSNNGISSVENDVVNANGTYTDFTSYGICEADINRSMVSPEFSEKLKLASSFSNLSQLKDDLIKIQASLKTAILDEIQAWSTDVEKASHRRHDYGPLIETWLKMLTDNGEIRDLTERTS